MNKKVLKAIKKVADEQLEEELRTLGGGGELASLLVLIENRYELLKLQGSDYFPFWIGKIRILIGEKEIIIGETKLYLK